jgi:hypothetical protein
MIVLHPELTLPVETDHYKSVADPAAHWLATLRRICRWNGQTRIQKLNQNSCKHIMFQFANVVHIQFEQMNTFKTRAGKPSIFGDNLLPE